MRTISTLILGLFMFGQLHAQSETDNFTTYDTTIIYRYNPYLTFTYYLRISRPTNLFKSGNADTASRPAIFFMPGVGEMNDDPANLYKYGPHYWLANGWDGSVVLGNGTHYPILISMVCNVNPPDPPIAGNFWVMDYMIKHYHIKPHGVHITGLSEGAFTWSGMLGITDTTGTGQTGADIGCREVTSMTLLSGAATSTGNWSIFGHWAQAYGGKAFLTVGYADAQTINPPQLAAAMNAAVPGSAYFTYNNIDGGQHGGWNTEYDPSQHNWQSFAPMGPYITTSTVANSAGTYKNGSSIFQWMLRQGDTTLVGGGKPVPVANAGSNQTITLPVNAVTLSGSGTESGGTISSYAWSWVSGPTQYAFNSASVASPTVSNLTAGTYVFKLTVTDANGVSASANVSVVVNSAGGSSTTYYNLPGMVQAANYASLTGAVTGQSQTLGVTTAIPSITSGESIAYNVNVASAGVYTMSFQVASAASGASFQLLNSAGTVLTTITVPNTSTLTTWTTVNVVVNLAAGQQVLKILSTKTPIWALNWFSSVAGSAGQQVIPGTIQAESYSTMLGVGTETTGDTGGGLDVGWITGNDYMSYPVNVKTTGSYTVSFRVASANSGASLQLDNGSSTVYAKVSVPNTGGWQSWTTVTATVNLTAGVQTIRVLSTGGTATSNLNWMSYALVSSGVYPIPGTIQSENYATSLGVSTQNTTDAGGGKNVDEIYNGDWMSYNVNVAAAGTYAVGLRVASAQSGASFALESSTGTVYATVSVPNTGGWQTWTTVNATVQLPAGAQTLKVVSLNASAWNINWMSFTAASTVYAIPGVIQSEDFAGSLGVSTQYTSDAGGGLNVDEIYNGDWMTYNVNVASAGTYTIGLRVATAQAGASLAIKNASGQALAAITLPNTGGWQTWTTRYASVKLPAGLQTLRVVSTSGSAWNINWMSFTVPVTTSSTGTEAVSGEAIAIFDDPSADSSSEAQADMLLLYPNPTPDAFQLSMHNPQTGKFLVQVISPSGRLVKTYSFEKGLPEMQVQISLAGLPTGVYVIRIGGTDWQVIKKVMKL